MIIHVTQEDLENGHPCNKRYCPIARAVSRTFGIDYIHIGADYFTFNSLDEDSHELNKNYHYKLPSEIHYFIAEFDMIGEAGLKPFSFELDLDFYLNVNEDDVRLAAYYLWENSGKPSGLSEEFYYKALHILRRQSIEDRKLRRVENVNKNLSTIVVKEEDSIDVTHWYEDIEQLMPELKIKKFSNINTKISWMFNNLKKYKSTELKSEGV